MDILLATAWEFLVGRMNADEEEDSQPTNKGTTDRNFIFDVLFSGIMLAVLFTVSDETTEPRVAAFHSLDRICVCTVMVARNMVCHGRPASNESIYGLQRFEILFATSVMILEDLDFNIFILVFWKIGHPNILSSSILTLLSIICSCHY
jgi:hypothetical protein